MDSGLSAVVRRTPWALRQFALVAVVLGVVVWASAELLPRNAWYEIGADYFDGPDFLEGWFRYDGGWYDGIAQDGYQYLGIGQQSEVAFFPAYPLAMRGVGPLVGGPMLAGILITLGSGALVAVFFHRWARERVGPEATRTALRSLLLFPYAWYLVGAVYGDALFIAASLGAFLLVERDKPIAAGVVAAVATACRPVGLAVVIGLIVRVVERRGRLPLPNAGPTVVPSSLRVRDSGVLLSLGGLGAWMAYLGARFEDPLLFVDVQKAWGQEPGPHTWFKVTFLQRIHRLPGWVIDSLNGSGTPDSRPWNNAVYTAGIALQAILVLGALVLIPRVVRRFGWGYGAYSLAVIGIPFIGSADFQGLGRYLLAAFPLFALVGEELTTRARLRVVWLLGSTGLLILLTSFYARAFYVA